MRFSTTNPVVRTVGGIRFLMTPSAFVSLDGSYTALREDFKTSFLNPVTELVTHSRRNIPYSRRKENTTPTFAVRCVNGRMHVGCHVFDAATKRQIRKWALS